MAAAEPGQVVVSSAVVTASSPCDDRASGHVIRYPFADAGWHALRDHDEPVRLRLAERPDPAPGPGELLLAVRAVALNHRDLTTVDGTYNPKQRLPLVPCSDAAAEVVAVGEGVTRFAAGDRVCPLFAQR